MALFEKRTAVDIKADVHEKVKRHCAAHGIKLSEFVEEAIIEKMIQPHIKE